MDNSFIGMNILKGFCSLDHCQQHAKEELLALLETNIVHAANCKLVMNITLPFSLLLEPPKVLWELLVKAGVGQSMNVWVLVVVQPEESCQHGVSICISIDYSFKILPFLPG